MILHKLGTVFFLFVFVWIWGFLLGEGGGGRAVPCCMWDLNCQPEMELASPALEALS